MDVTKVGRTHQIARWNDPLCPEVIGLDPEQAAFVVKRLADTTTP